MRHILILKDEHSRASECILGWLCGGGGLAWVGLGGLPSLDGLWWTLAEAWWKGRMDPNSTLHQSSSPPSDNSPRNQRFGQKKILIFENLRWLNIHPLCVSSWLPYFTLSSLRSIYWRKFLFFPAESDPGIARPLHLFPLPVLNASKLTMTWLLVLLCWWLKENKAVPTLPMFQLVQSMQRGKGLGRNKGRIKAVRKTFEKN